MRVLIACEESQVECLAFRAKGDLAFSCDLLPCSGGHPEWHIQGDVLDVLYDSWDLVIAHPPCTYLCRMQGYLLKRDPSRLDLCYQARDFFFNFLNYPGRIVIENPPPMKFLDLPLYDQLVYPFQFGDPFRKELCFWLKGVPPLFPVFSPPYEKFSSFVMLSRSGKLRSKSFPSVAAAMASQWRFD